MGWGGISKVGKDIGGGSYNPFHSDSWNLGGGGLGTALSNLTFGGASVLPLLTYATGRKAGASEGEAGVNAASGGLLFKQTIGKAEQRQANEAAQQVFDAQQSAAADQAALDQQAAAFRVARKKQLAASSSGYASTLLTGPQGLGDASGGQAKTLLGA